MREVPLPTIRLVLALVLVAASRAAEPGVTWTADRSNCAVGDAVDLILRYRIPRDAALVRFDRPRELLGEEMLTDYAEIEPYRDGDLQVREWRCTVIARRSGSWVLPAPRCTWRDAGGEEHAASGDQIALAVDLAEGPADLPEPSGLYMAPAGKRDTWTWVWAAAAAAGLCAGLLAGALVLRRRAAAVPPLPPLEVFVRELEGIRACTAGKEAGPRLGQAVRRFCGTSFDFDGLGATTAECNQLLMGRLPDGDRIELRGLLERIDGLCWASSDLALEQVLPLCERAHRLVAKIDRWRQRQAEEAARAAEEAA